MKSFFTAISLLTIFPVPQKLTGNIKTCSTYFPLVGLFLGVIYYCLAAALSAFDFSTDWIILSILCAMSILTGALHLDGLADMADGFWGGKTSDRILSIMKDSSTGVFGVVALILLMLIKWTALNHVVKDNNYGLIVPVVIVSRTTMTVLAGLFPYARTKGTGHDVISGTSFKFAAVAVMYTIPLMILLFGPASLILIVIGITTALLTGIYSRRKIKGITGDVLGATCEITEGLLLALIPFLTEKFFPGYWYSTIFR
jgi:adenosylcobinamide-GDP ribazoletransferase